MSATKSNMPGGTRLALLAALAITACLFAWRSNSFLTDHRLDRSELTPAQAELTNLLEPVLGRGDVRVAIHQAADGGQSFLILVNRPKEAFAIDPQKYDQVSMILDAAAGYDASVDRLQIQPIVFASGLSGGFSAGQLIELGGLLVIGGLLAFLLLTNRQEQPVAAPASPRVDLPANDTPRLHAKQVPDLPANNDSAAEARRIARENPQETAKIIRSWINSSEDGGS
ncbi:hypothetical protein WNY37_15795 [Henriciella sp. AS95]|uniref:hypothetical protein n=1 Tax=Henriciella sp. AS95 TaxID=3135782 RepID=UPI00317CD5EE